MMLCRSLTFLLTLSIWTSSVISVDIPQSVLKSPSVTAATASSTVIFADYHTAELVVAQAHNMQTLFTQASKMIKQTHWGHILISFSLLYLAGAIYKISDKIQHLISILKPLQAAHQDAVNLFTPPWNWKSADMMWWQPKSVD